MRILRQRFGEQVENAVIDLSGAPSGLSVSTENKLVYTRSSLRDATTATVKVTDKGGISKSIEISIGAVTDAAAVAVPSNLIWDGTTAKWDAVSGAEKYRVILSANDDSGLGGFSYPLRSKVMCGC